MTFGDDVLLGYDVYIRDDDGHVVIDGCGRRNNTGGPITIGDHVWCASKVSIMKNSNIGNGSIIGFGSIVTKKYNDENVLLLGQPAVVKKRNIQWEK